jgi:hypothetical protein
MDKHLQEEMMVIYNELKSSGVTSVSVSELERFTELFILSLPRLDDSMVRVEQL